MNRHTLLIAVFAILLAITLTVVTMMAMDRSYSIGYDKAVKSTNKQWIAELDKRGLIRTNNSGSFTWIDKD